MAKRRPAGDGLVRKRSDGRWEGRIVVGHKEDGRPIFRSVFARTQGELLKKLHAQLEAYRDVELTEASNLTLGQWLDKSCGRCGKHYRRKITAAGTKYEKPVWICATFNTRGKDYCPSQQIPESILITKTREILSEMLTEKERRSADLVGLSNLREFVQRILVPEQNQLVYVLADGRELKVPWQNPSRSLSWTPEMREEARQRKLEQEKSKREE